MSELDAHTQPLNVRLAPLAPDGFMSADEVLFLRRRIFADGIICEAELNALFELAARAPDGEPQWADFFAEAVADFYLREEEPHGYLTAEEFGTLRGRIEQNGQVTGMTRALLVTLMETAIETPPEMSAFVGASMKRSILEKDTPQLDDNDILLIKRWLYAAGGDGHTSITRAEAEILFDINDALDGDAPNAAWREIFTQGILNHLMATLGYSAVNRAEAMRRHAFISDHSIEVGGFFQKMAASVIDALRTVGEKTETADTVYAAQAHDRDAAIKSAEKITPSETDWLADRIARSGTVGECEKALLERIAEMKSNKLPDKLRALIENAA